MSPRSYKQNCALAHAVDIIGDRWALLIVRELLLRPRRYGQLLENLPGIGTNLLANRLKELRDANLVEQHGRQHYHLTDRGRGLEPAVLNLIRWGIRIPDSEGYSHREEWDLLALKALFNPDTAKSSRLVFWAALARAWIRIEPGAFEFGFDDRPAVVDIDWQLPLAELRHWQQHAREDPGIPQQAVWHFVSLFNAPVD